MAEKLRGKEKIIYAISMLVLLAFFAQFFNFPNKLSVVCVFLICGSYCILQRKILAGIREILLFLTMVLYIWFSGKRNLTGISIVLLPVLFQMAGRYMLNDAKDRKEFIRCLWCLIGAFVLGYTIHAVLNTGMYWLYGLGERGRVWKDVWTGYDVPATQHNIYFLPVLAVVFPAILYIKKHKAVCGVSLAIAAFFVWFSVISRSRTPLVIFAIVLLWGIFLWCVYNRKDKKTQKTILICGAAVLAVILAGCLVVWLNWEKIQATSFYATFQRGGGILHNVRFEAQLNALKQLFVYPFGGYQMDLGVLEMAHNLWLDTAKAAGILPFISLVVYTLLSAYDMFRMLRNGKVPSSVKYVLSSLWLVMMLYYMIEPALEATVQFLVPWTFMNGIVYELDKRRTI